MESFYRGRSIDVIWFWSFLHSQSTVTSGIDEFLEDRILNGKYAYSSGKGNQSTMDVAGVVKSSEYWAVHSQFYHFSFQFALCISCCAEVYLQRLVTISKKLEFLNLTFSWLKLWDFSPSSTERGARLRRDIFKVQCGKRSRLQLCCEVFLVQMSTDYTQSTCIRSFRVTFNSI